jgi:type IV secretory pathway VirB6-like protein
MQTIRKTIRKRFENDSNTIRKRFAGAAIKRKHGASFATMPFYYITDRVIFSEASVMFSDGTNQKQRETSTKQVGLMFES